MEIPWQNAPFSSFWINNFKNFKLKMILKINYVILIVRNKNINAKLCLFVKMPKKEKDIKEKLFF